MHPVQGRDQPRCFEDFIEDVGPFLRNLEHRLHRRAHLQTVSIFGPELQWKPWLNAPIYRHPALDFATIHLYEEGTIDFPEDTIAPAVSTGRLIRQALSEIRDGRPLLDSEHGPIHTYKDNGMTLPKGFDDEYFRHMQWAHFASGAAGGGMRWPNRLPHTLTPGMRQAQRALAGFLPMIDWPLFRRVNLNEEVKAAGANAAIFACGDAHQAIVWLLRKGALCPEGQLDDHQAPVEIEVSIPGLAGGKYLVTFWNTRVGRVAGEVMTDHASSEPLRLLSPAFVTDLALAVRRC
jgi:mannan endo-1,4-beta-mannosidase